MPVSYYLRANRTFVRRVARHGAATSIAGILPRVRSLLIVCSILGASILQAEETKDRFIVPENQPSVSFAPTARESTDDPKRQLKKLAEGFSGASFPEKNGSVVPGVVRSNPADPIFTSRVSDAAIVTADFARNEAAPIRQASASLPAQTDRSVPDAPNTPVAPETATEAATDSTADEADAADSLNRPIPFGEKGSQPGKMQRPKFSGAIAPLISVFGSLLIVLSAFLILVLLFKKVGPKGNRALPREVFENLGRTFLTQKLQLHLLRLGNRLILVSVTADGVTPVTEITDPDEVVPLLGMCRRLDANSSSELFRKTLSDLSQSEPDRGYFGTDVDAKPKNKSKAPAKSRGAVDLYSDPDESLADILASGLPTKGGKHG